MNTEHLEDPGAPERHGTGRTRRRPTAFVVSVATAAVLLVGSGGAYLAAGGQGESTDDPAAPTGVRTPPPLALDGWTGPGTGTGTGGIAPGEPDPSGARYVAAGELPEGPGSAPVYGPGAEVGRERVARLARALGMDGTPVAEGRSWRVGGQDGFGPSLTVHRDAPGGWSYSRYAPGTDDCRKVTVCSPAPGTPAGGPVSVAGAERAAKPVLEAAGLGGARTDASRVTGGGRVVTADPVVGGLPTYGWTTGLTVGRGGELLAGHGLLAAPVKGDTYPVLGAARTLELMNGAAGGGHRAGIGGCASPVPLKDRLEEPCGASTGVPKRVRGTVTVDEAVFGLAAHSVGGRQTLVPSWLFRVRGAGGGEAVTVTHPAVDPAYLAPASASASPAPAPTGKDRSGPVTSYSADGRRLSVRFPGGVCADYRVSARESGDRVTVTVTKAPWPDGMCVMIAKEHVKTVTLDAPLNGRTVTGADGREIPEAAS
ncbi:hypothetical protein QWJ26_27905 [Streptomyces sp. CSDS2]|uniref:hypothetical protein n=1 Tax=Streptomyces sp. CSDS2 TaxID=3055051 RepID=UPI0025AEE348|nr:hypothetical protein [Streptomyces sp. CSDS2]MDN3263568.1 hypothetical protein [Streptomyces sp. CSDS2]